MIVMNRDQFLQLAIELIKNPGREGPALLLESQLQGHPSGRRTFLALGENGVLTARGDRIEWSCGSDTTTWKQDPWHALQQVRHSHPGWYGGYLGYDLKNFNENLKSQNRDLTGAPDLFFFRPRILLMHDQKTGRITRNLYEGSEFSSERCSADQICSELTDGENLEQVVRNAQAKTRFGDFQLSRLESVTTPDSYLRKIRQAQHLIREGEFYEINLSHPLTGEFYGDPVDLFLKMRSVGPVPFAAYLAQGDIHLCSASPERFLKREGNKVLSQPIKGTAARSGDPELDRANRIRLMADEKERAENLMIVDLVRHDLSRVCRPGTVQVPELFHVESFGTVHQLYSTITGITEEGKDSVEVLRACFPMGSMTGAPKVRVMQAIEELEDYKRGIYSGAVGYIQPDGDFDFNVVIRSAILCGDEVIYPTGGAITSDSDPEEELEETRVKARALTETISMAGTQ